MRFSLFHASGEQRFLKRGFNQPFSAGKVLNPSEYRCPIKQWAYQNLSFYATANSQASTELAAAHGDFLYFSTIILNLLCGWPTPD
jgi:hypothetical protein